MKPQARTWIAVGAALVLGAGVAYADEHKHDQKGKSPTSERAGGAASSGTASGAASSGTTSSGMAKSDTTAKEMSGRVLQASPSRLFLEHMGAVVEFKIDSDAQISGGNVKTAGDLSEGQEVRTSFTVENKTTNVAKRISVSGQTSGPGAPSEQQRPMPGERSPTTPGTPSPYQPSTPSGK